MRISLSGYLFACCLIGLVVLPLLWANFHNSTNIADALKREITPQYTDVPFDQFILDVEAKSGLKFEMHPTAVSELKEAETTRVTFKVDVPIKVKPLLLLVFDPFFLGYYEKDGVVVIAEEDFARRMRSRGKVAD